MNIYVSNISFSADEEDLELAFSEFGAVSSVKIVIDRETGKSRGFGFVEMDDEDEALNAIESLNGFELLGRELVVRKANPPKSGGGGGGGQGYQNKRGGKNKY
ncbi:MAG: RNA-binding protein [Microscillaceae bacterium]|nr:RNA-binding protein [Microscillaceae bacterium]